MVIFPAQSLFIPFHIIRKKPKGKRGKSKVKKSEQENQKLEGKKIIELAELCKKIELHYGFPQDIEFGVEKEKIFILQSRPITTL